MKILVADDSKTNLTLITSALQSMGHEVVAVTNSISAIEVFKTDRPDLIILDVVMDGIDGFECARMIRAIDTEDWIPIIFLSSNIDDESIAKGIDAGGDDYLTKPFSQVTLEAKIKAMQRISDMRKKLTETMQKLSILSCTDPLTGLYNRFQFDKTMKEKVARAHRHNTIFSLLFLDLDHFKLINDNLGHIAGDMLLKTVASRMQSTLRIDDFIARMGGDEFAVILDDINTKKDAEIASQKIIDALNPPYNLAGTPVHITSSIGIAYYPTDGEDPGLLIQNADIAMYYAKELGRNNYQCYTNELHDKLHRRFRLEDALKFALERNELMLTYQPIYNLQDKKMVSVEAIINWNHPELGSIPPKIFMPLAEDSGLNEMISIWLLRKVFQQGESWYKDGNLTFKLSTNISPRQLMKKSFPQLIQSLLLETKMPPDFFELELTENSTLTYSNLSEKTIKEIRDIGVTIALDDFGSGYSSLNYLSRLPINTIKIDESFIQQIASKPNDGMIVKSIITLGKNLGFNVVATGIETKDELKFLINNQCIQGQGPYLHKPETPEQIKGDLKITPL